MKATLWVEKGKYKPHQKWRMTQKKKKNAAEQDVYVSGGEMKLRSFKWIPGESIGRRKYSLISKKE